MLITRQIIQQYRQISKSADNDLINQSINDAELLDLKPLLGELLYIDLVAKIAEQRYIDLLIGRTYAFAGQSYTFEGLNPVLANFAYARYVIFSSYVDTPFGLVSKVSQDSLPVSDANKRAMSKSAEQTAYSYFAGVRDFLNRHPNIYPLWRGCTTERVFKFNIIQKSN